MIRDVSLNLKRVSNEIRDNNLKWYNSQVESFCHDWCQRDRNCQCIRYAGMLLSIRFACKYLRAACKNSGTRIEAQEKRKKKKKRRIRVTNTFLSFRTKSLIICHLLGLKVSDESLKGSSAGNRTLKKWPSICGASGRRGWGRGNTRDIFLQAKNWHRYSPPTARRNESSEFIGAIFRRNENCPLYFAQ